jgi:putative ABC transport system substrate-binding protein
MRRRQFITLVGGAAAWPVVPRAEERDRMRRIGVLTSYAPTDSEGVARLGAFTKTLQEPSWTDSSNIRIEVRWFAGNVQRAKAYAAELIALAPEVIVVSSNPALAQLRALERIAPIVFTQVSDPVEGGFVSSLARPGGNITGFQNFEPDIGGKWLGVLKEAVPTLSKVAVLVDRRAPSHAAFLRSAVAVAPSLGVQVAAAPYTDGDEIEPAITRAAGNPNPGLIVAPHPTAVTRRGDIITLTARRRIPAVYPFRLFAVDGGLMSYGFDQLDQWRGAARYVDRILRGEKPSELPVQAPTRYELVINLKTANALDLNIPPTLPLRADEVIE